MRHWQSNLAYLLGQAVCAGALPLQVLTEGAIIPARNGGGNVRVPDLAVAPADDQRGDQVVTAPILLFEILSPGNSAQTRDYLRAYATLASVREIVVIHGDVIRAEVHRRDPSGAWLADPEIVGPVEALRLPSIALDVRIEDVYARTWMTRAPGR
jgi:Uma2 family endonuclease